MNDLKFELDRDHLNKIPREKIITELEKPSDKGGFLR